MSTRFVIYDGDEFIMNWIGIQSDYKSNNYKLNILKSQYFFIIIL